ncbi:2-dehydro-3-deoxygluconokinase [Flavobacterium akiainvivens]|uniref:2-dehydro-3-deoxygluconokinase n=1 Tax=Flavobacterium akiainvivens TaxID=1202724 RepID=A0A0N0RR70_9FLAO|nr:sugar kinase [Flavobacterium akiainvivens]KOS08230.1 2-dehydro-3-deoxygluconokinase [Flavobacterium akiainvivens]SFQ35981.1 2-dehydro-3-deoxygluconokinase [Flavobacterium akiainvivens]
MGKVVTFGEVIMRLSPPGYNKMKQSHSLEFFFGGTEMNVAASLAQFGLNVQHISNVSDDFVGQAALACMQGYGIDISHIKKVNHPLGLYFMEVGSGLRASQITYNRLHGAFANIKPEQVDWETILDGCTLLHWTGISPAISEGAYQTLKQGLELALSKGITITADPAYRSNLWQYGRNGHEVLAELCRLSTVFIGGVNEVNEILGTQFTQDEEGFKAAAQKLIQDMPNIAKVYDKVRTGLSATHQKIFAQAWDGKTYFKTSEIEITDVVDRIGTGDAYAAGLVYGLETGMAVAETIAFANAACALKHTIAGDVNLTSVAEISEVAQGNVSGRLKR